MYHSRNRNRNFYSSEKIKRFSLRWFSNNINNNLVFWVDEERAEREQDEDGTADERDCANGDSRGDQPAADHGEASANRVAQNAADTNAVNIFTGS